MAHWGYQIKMQEVHLFYDRYRNTDATSNDSDVIVIREHAAAMNYLEHFGDSIYKLKIDAEFFVDNQQEDLLLHINRCCSNVTSFSMKVSGQFQSVNVVPSKLTSLEEFEFDSSFETSDQIEQYRLLMNFIMENKQLKRISLLKNPIDLLSLRRILAGSSNLLEMKAFLQPNDSIDEVIDLLRRFRTLIKITLDTITPEIRDRYVVAFSTEWNLVDEHSFCGYHYIVFVRK